MNIHLKLLFQSLVKSTSCDYLPEVVVIAVIGEECKL